MVSVAKVLDAYRALKHVKYTFGAKADGRPFNQITELDCSGFVQAVLKYAGMLDFPAGSVLQHERVKILKWREIPYENLKFAKDDGARLFIMFIAPTDGRPGHVALVNAGRTIECASGFGVGRRRWNARPLASRNPVVYEVPTAEAAQREKDNRH